MKSQFDQLIEQTLNESVMGNEQIAEILFNVISTQPFVSWYQSKFEDFVTGEEDAPSKDQLLLDLQKLISRFASNK
jgi:hypothetical protein